MFRILSLLFMVCFTSIAYADDGSEIQRDNMYPRVKMITNYGEIVVELDRRRAPITVNNFLRYVKKNSYDNTVFHRIVTGFVVQGGGYDLEMNPKPAYPAIINESGNGMKNEMYTISMARQDDPHTATRQFFFNIIDNASLDPGKDWGYTVFGLALEGTDVLDEMANVETHYDLKWGWPNVPVKPVVLEKVEIIPEPQLQVAPTN